MRGFSDHYRTPHRIDLFVTFNPDLLSTVLQLFCIHFFYLLIVWSIIYPLLAKYCPRTILFTSSFASSKRSLYTSIQSCLKFTIALAATMGKFGKHEPGFSFAELNDTGNYWKWTREMLYSFDFTGLWVYALLDKENHKQVAIILKDPDLKDELKLERQVNCADKIIA